MPVIELVSARAPTKARVPDDGRVRRLVACWVARGTKAWQQARLRRQSRHYLMTMDERTLSDIGVSRAQALFEIDTGRHRRH